MVASLSVRCCITLRTITSANTTYYTHTQTTTQCQIRKDHAATTATATAGPNHEAAATATTTQATSAATAHEVHDKTAVDDETAGATAHDPPSAEMSATAREGAAIVGEVIADRATTEARPEARAAAQILADRLQMSHGLLPKPSSPIRLTRRSPRMSS